jgi:hypothetical protein
LCPILVLEVIHFNEFNATKGYNIYSIPCW